MVATAPANRINPLDGVGFAAERGDNSLVALRRGKFDFKVELVPIKNPATGEVITEGEDKDGNPKTKFYATVRADTKEVLGIVESRYVVFQNEDLFSIADTMVEEDGARITRSSALTRGSRCFMNLEWPEDRSISVLGDIVGRRAIIQSSHDGKFSALIRLQPLRLACVNGMVVPVPAFSFEFRIRHTKSGTERIEEARRIMSGASQYFETFGKVANRMAVTPVTDSHAKLLLKKIPSLSKDSDTTANRRKEILDLFQGGQAGSRHEALKGTAWGFLNAASEYADYAGKSRKARGASVAVQQFKSSLEGTSMKLKLSAYDVLLRDKSLGLGEFNESLKALAKSN